MGLAKVHCGATPPSVMVLLSGLYCCHDLLFTTVKNVKKINKGSQVVNNYVTSTTVDKSEDDHNHNDDNDNNEKKVPHMSPKNMEREEKNLRTKISKCVCSNCKIYL